MSRRQVRVGDRVITLSNLAKVFYPESGFTKGECIAYYSRIAPVLLPYLLRRPLNLKRYPDGVEGALFYEKQCPGHHPEWLSTIAVPNERRGQIDFCSIENQAGLLWVINTGSIELHPLLMRAEALERPTWMVFDLDPGEPAGILECITVALHMRDMLANLGLRCFPKTSGLKGLHFYVPLNTPVTFARVKKFARTVAQVMEKEFPKTVVSRMKKDLRPGRVLVDWSQNEAHKSTVSVYSLRAGSRPTVSTPVDWQELSDALADKSPDQIRFDSDVVLKRVESKGDLFKPVLELQQKIP